MQYLYIDKMGEDDYTNYLDKLQGFNLEEELMVIIHTTGGENPLCDILCDEIVRFKYHLKVYSAQSCGMIILDRLFGKCVSVKISDYGIYLVHLPARQISIGMGGKVSRGEFDIYCNEVMKESIPHTFDILTEDEKVKYENGDDVLIMPSRVKEYYKK